MTLFYTLFGEGKELNALQMGSRAVVLFFITLILIRLAGRRSFGMHTAFDNVLAILLGAILSRAVVGASPFFPTVVSCLVISILHRFFAWLGVRYSFFEKVIKGGKIPLFLDGLFIKKNFERGLVSEEDIRAGLRNVAQTESFDNIKAIHMEQSGHITVVKKEE